MCNSSTRQPLASDENTTVQPHAPYLRRLAGFFRRNAVLTVALFGALVTSLIVPPDRAYLSYFDWKTLSCLYCVLAVVGALRNILFFTMLAHRIVKMFRSLRLCLLALCCITFIGSMFIANDMALLTFLPLGYFVLSSTGNDRYLPYTFILQNIAANLGGMLTPFGNPQNLYLYTKFMIPTGEFMQIMLPSFTLSVAMLALCCCAVPSLSVNIGKTPVRTKRLRLAVYLALFTLAIVIVFRFVPYWTGLVVITGTLLVMDRKALRTVDYPLLCTFAAFFVFSGNMARIPFVRELFQTLLQRSTLVFSVASCQIISNVPTAILLSQFSENYRELLVGVNIGGTGTLIASLASLITFREYQRLHPENIRQYLLLFTGMNVLFLGVLLAMECVRFYWMT